MNLPGNEDNARHDPPAFGLEADSVVRVPAGRGAISDMALTPGGGRLIIGHHGSDAISVLDTKTCRVAATLTGLSEPFAVATSGADETRAFLSTARAAYDSLDVIDVSTDTLVASHPLAHRIADVAVSPDGTRVYVARTGAHGADVAVVDVDAGEGGVIDLPTAPGSTATCVRLSRDGRRLYVGSNAPGGGALSIVDIDTAGHGRVVGVVELGLPLRDVALAADGRTAYVASCGPVVGAVVDVVEAPVDARAAKIVRTRKIDEIAGPLTRLTLSRDGSRAYALSDDRITVLGTRTLDVVGVITAAGQPSSVVESPDGTHLYVGDFSGVVLAARIAAPAAAADDTHGLDESTAWLPALAHWEPVLA